MKLKDDPTILVYRNDIDRAVAELKKRVAAGGYLKILRTRYENPSVQDRRRAKRLSSADRQKKASKNDRRKT